VSVLFPYDVEITKENLAGPIQKAMETKEDFFIKLYKVMFMYFPTWVSTFIFFYEIESNLQIFFVLIFFVLDSCSFFLKKHAKLSKEEILDAFLLINEKNKKKFNVKNNFFMIIFFFYLFFISVIYQYAGFQEYLIFYLLGLIIIYLYKIELSKKIIKRLDNKTSVNWNMDFYFDCSKNFYIFGGRLGRFPFFIIISFFYITSPFLFYGLFNSKMIHNDPIIIVHASIVVALWAFLFLLKFRILYEVVFLTAKYWVEENHKAAQKTSS
jgi:hypothetical protein